GFLVYLGYYAYPLYLIRKGQRAAAGLDDQQLKQLAGNVVVVHASFIMGVLALLMNLGMETFYTPFLQGFLWLWLGLGARSAVVIRSPLRAAPSLPAAAYSTQPSVGPA